MCLYFEFIYNSLLLGLTFEEIATIIYSAFNRPFANISLQIYPALILIGNIGYIIKFLNLKLMIYEKNILEKKTNLY